jgi:hypothetical protein
LRQLGVRRLPTRGSGDFRFSSSMLAMHRSRSVPSRSLRRSGGSS